MTDYQYEAERLLGYGYNTVEQRTQQAEIYAYMARTEKMTPPPAEKAKLPEELYLISTTNEKGQTVSVELHMNSLSANMKLNQFAGSIMPEGYGVSVQPVKFAS
ncbi:hypothetical protein SEA_ATUIN_232 [Arthrobacter phage Atuin]|nr:hypothetical protein SEA_ATUIN_31 [Arthrobacter phage Atuin]